MTPESETLERRGLARGLKIFLDLLFWATGLVGVMLLVSLPISMSSSYEGGWQLIIPTTIGEESLRPRLPLEFEQPPPKLFEHASIGDGHGLLRLSHHNLPLHLLNATGQFLFFVVFLWAVHLLRQILATTVRGRPFDPVNPRRLSTLGWIIISASLATSLLQYFASKWILSLVEILSIPTSPSIQSNKEWIVCGLLVLVLAAIWKEAVRMAEEQSLTV